MIMLLGTELEVLHQRLCRKIRRSIGQKRSTRRPRDPHPAVVARVIFPISLLPEPHSRGNGHPTDDFLRVQYPEDFRLGVNQPHAARLFLEARKWQPSL